MWTEQGDLLKLREPQARLSHRHESHRTRVRRDVRRVRQLHAAAVDQPDERNAQPLGEIGHPQDVLGLVVEEFLGLVAEGRGPLNRQMLKSRTVLVFGPIEPRPMYYVYMMYQLFGTELVRSATDDPLVNVYAARRPDGSVTVMIVVSRRAAAA